MATFGAQPSFEAKIAGLPQPIQQNLLEMRQIAVEQNGLSPMDADVMLEPVIQQYREQQKLGIYPEHLSSPTPNPVGVQGLPGTQSATEPHKPPFENQLPPSAAGVPPMTGAEPPGWVEQFGRFLQENQGKNPLTAILGGGAPSSAPTPAPAPAAGAPWYLPFGEAGDTSVFGDVGDAWGWIRRQMGLGGDESAPATPTPGPGGRGGPGDGVPAVQPAPVTPAPVPVPAAAPGGRWANGGMSVAGGAAPEGRPSGVGMPEGAAGGLDFGDWNWEDLMTLGLNLMMAGEAQPGSTRGPSLLGAMGQAGAATLAGKKGERAAGAESAMKLYDIESDAELKRILQEEKAASDRVLREIQRKGNDIDAAGTASQILARADQRVADMQTQLWFLELDPAAQQAAIQQVRAQAEADAARITGASAQSAQPGGAQPAVTASGPGPDRMAFEGVQYERVGPGQWRIAS